MSDVNFWSLSDLLSAKELPMPQQSFCDRIKALDLAIEQSGIQEINGCGRLVNADNERASKLLTDCLAEYDAYQVPGSNANPLLWFEYDSPLCRFGWTMNKMPDFIATVRNNSENRTINKIRRNLLDVAIDEILKKSLQNDVHSVFQKLKELALEGKHSFTGLIEGDALIYTDSNNELKKLTKDALRKRLTRRQ